MTLINELDQDNPKAYLHLTENELSRSRLSKVGALQTHTGRRDYKITTPSYYRDRTASCHVEQHCSAAQRNQLGHTESQAGRPNYRARNPRQLNFQRSNCAANLYYCSEYRLSMMFVLIFL